jgi:catechol 2,3-dioxygenase-like lactoylglutathione lyase family enzyme
MNRVERVLETCVYAEDLEAAERFYAGVLGLEAFARSPGRHVFFRCGQGVFLVFNPARTADAEQNTDVPTHGAHGAGHVAFAIEPAAFEEWRSHLQACGVEIEAEVAWPRGGASLYVRDPAGNSVELAPPQIWALPPHRS